jgi:hypothetical protein
MKRSVVVLAVLSVCFWSCNKEVPALTKEQVKAKVDSIAAARIKELDAMARKDLEYRMKIELKGKVDSILNARRLAHDTSAKQPVISH